MVAIWLKGGGIFAIRAFDRCPEEHAVTGYCYVSGCVVFAISDYSP